MQKYIIILLILILYLTVTYFACDFTDDKLKIINTSDEKIGILLNIHYPDTSLVGADEPKWTWPNPTPINPNDTTNYRLLNRRWKYIFRDTEKVTFIFIDWDIIDEFGYDINRYEVLSRKILSETQLDSLNWVLIYP